MNVARNKHSGHLEDPYPPPVRRWAMKGRDSVSGGASSSTHYLSAAVQSTCHGMKLPRLTSMPRCGLIPVTVPAHHGGLDAFMPSAARFLTIACSTIAHSSLPNIFAYFHSTRSGG
jgi:hypothetical protein